MPNSFDADSPDAASSDAASGILCAPAVTPFALRDDGTFPNHPEVPLVLYRHALDVDVQQMVAVERLIRHNGWGSTWRNGIYRYHHYHSTAHEVLAVMQGGAQLLLGGDDGATLDVNAGDVLILPAGMAHKNIGREAGFKVIGAYPEGQQWDMNYGRADERPQADRNIKRVPLPTTDPIYGDGGPLHTLWGL